MSELYENTENENKEQNENALPIFRSIRGAVIYLKKLDDGCQISEYMLRRAIKDGNIHARTVGRKYIVNVNEIIEYYGA